MYPPYWFNRAALPSMSGADLHLTQCIDVREGRAFMRTRGRRRSAPSMRMIACVTVGLLFMLTSSLSGLAQDAPATPSVTFPALTPLPAAVPRADGPLPVVATTPILADITRQIGGERLAVKSILPPNADPHD